MEEHNKQETEPKGQVRVSNTVNKALLIIGILLTAAGVWFLLANLNLIPPQFYVIFKVLRSSIWPVTLILIGILIILASTKGELTVSTEGKKLYRSKTNRKIAGVAGGLAEYLDVDPTLVRLLFIVLLLINFGAALVTYIVAAIIIPEEPNQKEPTEA